MKGFVVTLREDVSPEDAESLRNLLYLISGVAQVDYIPTDGVLSEHVNRTRIRQEIMRNVLRVFSSEGSE